jgi:hypothetical protein
VQDERTIKKELARLYRLVLGNIGGAINGQFPSLCSDGWSSRGWKPYLCQAAGWLSSAFQPMKATLDFRPIPASHDADVLKKIFEEIQNELRQIIEEDGEEVSGSSPPFFIPFQFTLALTTAPHTSDGGGNFKNAIQGLHAEWHHCDAHRYSLVLKKAVAPQENLGDEVLAEGDIALGDLPVAFDALLKKARAVVSTIRGSSILTEFVRKHDKELKVAKEEARLALLSEAAQRAAPKRVPEAGRTLKADVETRFASTLLLLERLVDMQPTVELVQVHPEHSKKMPEQITKNDFVVMQEIVSVMKPFSDAITQLSSSSTITYSLGVYLSRHLRDRLHQRARTAVGQQIQERLLVAMNHYISLTHPSAPHGAYLSDFQLIRVVLDPRFKSLKPFMTEQVTIKSRAATLLRAHLETVTDAEVERIKLALADFTQIAEPALKRQKLDDLVSSNDGLRLFAADEGPAREKDEVDLFLEAAQIAIHEDPLAWWRKRDEFPRLRALARRLLPTFATSILCEEVNSLAGHIVNPRRASLAGTTVKHLVFLKANSQFIPDDY